jgi:ribosomal protein L16/L10AE
VAEIQPGKVIYEIVGVPEELAVKRSAWLLPSCLCARPSCPVKSGA